MSTELNESEWNEAVKRSKSKTENAFARYADRFFWREYDLHGYMYGVLYAEPLLRPYIRREHRIWYKTKRKQLLVLDFALLDPEMANEGYPYWPVKEMIQLKYPVEFKTGRTEPDNLRSDMIASSPPYYVDRCRTRIIRKLWVDYRKFQKAVGKARNVSSMARCHIMYFDLAGRPSYSSNEELKQDLKRLKGIDMEQIGSWHLVVTYRHASPKSESSQ